MKHYRDVLAVQAIVPTRDHPVIGTIRRSVVPDSANAKSAGRAADLLQRGEHDGYWALRTQVWGAIGSGFNAVTSTVSVSRGV